MRRCWLGARNGHDDTGDTWGRFVEVALEGRPVPGLHHEIIQECIGEIQGQELRRALKEAPARVAGDGWGFRRSARVEALGAP